MTCGGLGDPAVALDAAAELQVVVDLLDLFRRHRGDLPIMEDAGIIELLDDLRADAVQLGEIVRRAARRGQQLETSAFASTSPRRAPADPRHGRLHLADIDAASALAARNAVERGARNEIAIEPMARPASSLPGIGIGDAVGIAIGVEDRDDRNLQPSASLIANCSLLVSMTKIRSGMPPISLMPPSARSSLSRSRDSIRRSFLVRPGRRLKHSSTLRRRWIEPEMVFQLVSMPPSQRGLT